ncbi:DUF1820 family protein [Carnimonas nigrificans]|uniref:DUF1820 family protein n=1 Tax=Carnimonas nigrificans TaxID=64323 RepID=UPI00047237C2|nr:DUF1820 family protein [Carnimonas nigrificans]
MSVKPVYRVTVHQQGEVWELYAREIYQSELWGFLEVEEFVFSDNAKLVIDTSTDKLRRTFEGVKRSYLPVNMIVRIDEVEREGEAKTLKSDGKIASFPQPAQWPRKPSDD